MFVCKFCKKECKNSRSLSAHQNRCTTNPDRIKAQPWSKEKKELWSKKCVETKCNNTVEWTDEKRLASSVKSKEINAQYWTDENRQNHSKVMQNVVKSNPDSYSKNNVSGRVKMHEVLSAVGITKVKGSWELAVAVWLNENEIKWTNEIKPYNYKFQDKWHMYFPDFLLIDHNIIIEVKGYERERDKFKWDSVEDKQLAIIKEREFNDLDNFLRSLITPASK